MCVCVFFTEEWMIKEFSYSTVLSLCLKSPDLNNKKMNIHNSRRPKNKPTKILVYFLLSVP